jgi:hypothetical protein
LRVNLNMRINIIIVEFFLYDVRCHPVDMSAMFTNDTVHQR